MGETNFHTYVVKFPPVLGQTFLLEDCLNSLGLQSYLSLGRQGSLGRCHPLTQTNKILAYALLCTHFNIHFPELLGLASLFLGYLPTLLSKKLLLHKNAGSLDKIA